MIKVIGGEYRSRNLLTPGPETVPTKNMTRAGIANALTNLTRESTILDLFAGSGAMGIELLSRGAKACTFVDSSKDAISCIKTNIQSLNINERCLVLNKDYESALSSFALESKHFDIVFLDPPYKMVESYNKVLRILLDSNLLNINGAVVLEYEGDIPFSQGEYSSIKTYNYGRTHVAILRR